MDHTPQEAPRRTPEASAPFRAEPLLGGGSASSPPPPVSPGGRRPVATSSTSPIEPGRKASRSPLPCVAHDNYTFHQNCGCAKASHIQQRRMPHPPTPPHDGGAGTTPTRRGGSVRYETVDDASPDVRAGTRGSTRQAAGSHSPCPHHPEPLSHHGDGRRDAQSAARVLCCDDIDDETTTLAIADASVLFFVVQHESTERPGSSNRTVYALERGTHTHEYAMVERDTLSSRRYARHPAPLGRLCGALDSVPTCMALVETDHVWVGMSNGCLLSWRKVASGDTSVDNIVTEMDEGGGGGDGRHTPPLHSKHTATGLGSSKLEGPTVLCHWTRLQDAMLQHVHPIVSLATAKAGSVYSVCSGGLVLRWTTTAASARRPMGDAHSVSFATPAAWSPTMLAAPRGDAAGKNPQARCATCFMMPCYEASPQLSLGIEVVVVGMKSGATFLWSVGGANDDDAATWQQPTRLDPGASNAASSDVASSPSISSPRQQRASATNSSKRGPRSSPHGGVTAFCFVPTLDNMVIGRSSSSVSSASTPYGGAHCPPVIPSCAALCVGHDNGRIVVWTHQHGHGRDGTDAVGNTNNNALSVTLSPNQQRSTTSAASWQLTAVMDPRCRSPVSSLALVSVNHVWALFVSGDCIVFDLANHSERSRRRIWRGGGGSGGNGDVDDGAPASSVMAATTAASCAASQLTHVRFVSGHVMWATGRNDGALTTMFVPSQPRQLDDFAFPLSNNLSFHRPTPGGWGPSAAAAAPPALQMVNDAAITLLTEAASSHNDGDALSEFERVERMLSAGADDAGVVPCTAPAASAAAAADGGGAGATPIAADSSNKFLAFLVNANKELLDVQARLDEHMVVLHDVVEEEFHVLKAFHEASQPPPPVVVETVAESSCMEPQPSQQHQQAELIAPPMDDNALAVVLAHSGTQTASLSPPPSPLRSPHPVPCAAATVSAHINEEIIAEQHLKLADLTARLDAAQESNVLLSEMLAAKDALLLAHAQRTEALQLQEEQLLTHVGLGGDDDSCASDALGHVATDATTVATVGAHKPNTSNGAPPATASDDENAVDGGMTPLSPLSLADAGVPLQPPSLVSDEADERERVLLEEECERHRRENDALRADLLAARAQLKQHESDWEEAQDELKRAHSALLANSEKFESSSEEFTEAISTLERNLLAEANRSAALEQELAQSRTMALLVGQQNDNLRERLNAIANEREPTAASVRSTGVLRRRKSAKEIAVTEFQQKLLEKTDAERLLDNLEESLANFQRHALDAIAAADARAPPLVRPGSTESNASFVCSRCSTCVPPTGSARSALEASLAPMMSGSFMPASCLDINGGGGDGALHHGQQQQDTPPPLTSDATAMFSASNDEMALAFQALSQRGEALARALDKATESKQIAAQAFEVERRQFMSRSVQEAALVKRELESSVDERKKLADTLDAERTAGAEKDGRIAELTRELDALRRLMLKEQEAFGRAQSETEDALAASNTRCDAERGRCAALEEEARTLRDALAAHASRAATEDDGDAASAALAESLRTATEQRNAAAHRVAELEAQTQSLCASEDAMRSASNALALRVAVCEGEVGNWQGKVGELEETVRRLQADRLALQAQTSELRQREQDAIEEAWDVRRQLQHQAEAMASSLNVEKRLRATHEQRALDLQVELDTQRPRVEDTARLDELLRRNDELQVCIAAQEAELLQLRSTSDDGRVLIQQARNLAIENDALRRQLGVLEGTCAQLHASERQQERDMNALKALLSSHGTLSARTPSLKTTRSSPQSSVNKPSPQHSVGSPSPIAQRRPQRRSSSSPPQTDHHDDTSAAGAAPAAQPRGTANGQHRRRPHCQAAGHDPATCIWCAGLTHKTMGGTFGVCGDGRRFLEFQHSATAGHVQSQPPSHSVSPMPAPTHHNPSSTSYHSAAEVRHPSASVGTTLSSPVSSAAREPVGRSLSSTKPPVEASNAVRELYFSAAPQVAAADTRAK